MSHEAHEGTTKITKKGRKERRNMPLRPRAVPEGLSFPLGELCFVSFVVPSCASCEMSLVQGPLRLRAVKDSGDAVLYQHDVEIHQEADLLVGQTKVGEKLLLVDRCDCLDGLDLDDDFIVDDQVGIETRLNGNSVVNDGDRVLTNEGQALLFQFARECRFVYRFPKPRPETGVYPECGIDDLSGRCVFDHLQAVPKAGIFLAGDLLRVLRGAFVRFV